MPLCTTSQDLNYYDLSEFDLLITCGWSDELNGVADEILSIGVHCASLDRYSYGTPIQLQIIDGIKFTTPDTNFFSFNNYILVICKRFYLNERNIKMDPS